MAKILSDDEELIYEFGAEGNFSTNALLNMALAKKFADNLDPIYLLGDAMNNFIRSIICCCEKEFSKSFFVSNVSGNSIWHEKLDSEINARIANFITASPREMGWDKMNASSKVVFLNDVFFPWVQPAQTITELITCIDDDVS